MTRRVSIEKQPDGSYVVTDLDKQVTAEAEVAVQNIPGWASWTEAETLAYIESEVVDLASAKTVLKAMARMVIALRNKAWPHLEG